MTSLWLLALARLRAVAPYYKERERQGKIEGREKSELEGWTKQERITRM